MAMFSSVLSSSRAIQVNITIMRTFIKMRSFLAMESGLADRVGRLEKGTNQLFKTVFERKWHLVHHEEQDHHLRSFANPWILTYLPNTKI